MGLFNLNNSEMRGKGLVEPSRSLEVLLVGSDRAAQLLPKGMLVSKATPYIFPTHGWSRGRLTFFLAIHALIYVSGKGENLLDSKTFSVMKKSLSHTCSVDGSASDTVCLDPSKITSFLSLKSLYCWRDKTKHPLLLTS